MKTPMQELFTQLEIEHPELFNVNTVEGKKFIHSYHNFITLEKEQIENSFYKGIQEQQSRELSEGLFFKTEPNQYYINTFNNHE